MPPAQMHYNPHSVAVVQGTVRAAARQRGLHATAIELCSSRWNTTAAGLWSDKRKDGIPSYQRVLSEDEFQVAFEASVASGLADVILADQVISRTGRRLGASLVGTVGDLLTPAGARRVFSDLGTALRSAPTFGRSALSSRLLAGAPLAVARYLYQSPSALPFLSLSATALWVAAAVDEATGAVATWEDGLISAVVAIVVGRAGFVSLIQERDRVLARNIRAACLAAPQGGGTPGAEAQAGSRSHAAAADEASGSAVLVAVLGMAHLAGVREALLLLDEEESPAWSADPDE
jgi:hypothetical protein